jgi:hypothetical protein
MARNSKNSAISDICYDVMDSTTSERICQERVGEATDSVMQPPSEQARPTKGKPDKLAHELKPQYRLDVEYSAFKDCSSTTPRGNILEDMKFVFSLKDYEDQEQVEIRCGSVWRGSYLSNVQNSAFSSLKARYTRWLEIHKRALIALEDYFISKHFVPDGMQQHLLDLWAILPLDLFPSGVPKHGQERMVEWLNNAEHDAKQAIDLFLDELAEFCFKDGVSKKRIKFCKTHDAPKPLFRSTVHRLLFKRLLLQTPILFWPAIFKSSVSYCDIMSASTLPDVCYLSDKVVVTCQNRHIDRDGFETISLWQRGLEGDVLDTKRPIKTIKLEIKLQRNRSAEKFPPRAKPRDVRSESEELCEAEEKIGEETYELIIPHKRKSTPAIDN